VILLLAILTQYGHVTHTVTHTHTDDSIYRASIASHCKNCCNRIFQFTGCWL